MCPTLPEPPKPPPAAPPRRPAEAGVAKPTRSVNATGENTRLKILMIVPFLIRLRVHVNRSAKKRPPTTLLPEADGFLPTCLSSPKREHVLRLPHHMGGPQWSLG